MAKGAILCIIYSSVKPNLCKYSLCGSSVQEAIFGSEDAEITGCVDIKCLSEAPSLKVLGARTSNPYKQKYALICHLLKPGNIILWNFQGKKKHCGKTAVSYVFT